MSPSTGDDHRVAGALGAAENSLDLGDGYRRARRRSGGDDVASDEERLFRQYAATHDQRIREELIVRFLPLARSLALRYRGAREPVEDLIQVANLGLVKALDGFDPERGKSFVAYAAPTILGELRRHFRDHVMELRLPRGLQERTLTEEEVAEALLAGEARRTLSLDAPRSRKEDESAPMVETVGWAEPGYEAVETQVAADNAELTERERLVLWLRFEDNLTQKQIGDRIGVSQMQVSRIMRGALQRLLEAVEGEEPVR